MDEAWMAAIWEAAQTGDADDVAAAFHGHQPSADEVCQLLEYIMVEAGITDREMAEKIEGFLARHGSRLQ